MDNPIVADDLLADLRSIDRMARWCVRKNRHGMAGFTTADAYESARFAIIEKLAEASATDTEIAAADLMTAGKQAVRREMKLAGKHESAGALKYWAPTATDPWEERFIERMALHEVLQALPVDLQQTLILYVAHGCNISAAGAHLGIGNDAAYKRLRKIRERFVRSWFDWEKPAKPARRERVRQKPLATHCSKGHKFTPENTGMAAGHNLKVRTARYCLTCDAQRQRERYRERTPA